MLKFYDKEFSSRLLIGTALYPSPAIMQQAIRASGAEMTHQSAWGGSDTPFWLMSEVKRKFD